MKIYKLLLTFLITVLLFSCSEDVMDEVNENLNDPSYMVVDNLIPDAILKSAYETTGTDIAWYTSIYIEHNAGTWAQGSDADSRIGQQSASLMNNSWNSLYDVMNICKDIIDKTDPETGDESINFGARGIGQILMAYNLAIGTDMWGDMPYSEAFQGSDNLKPVYDKQSDLYDEIFSLLDDGIENLENADGIDAHDYIYGGDIASWIKAAYSLKARYYLHLSEVSTTAYGDALNAITNGFTSAADNMLFNEYAFALPNANPWAEYWYLRDHNSISTTFYDILTERNDPRTYGLIPGDNPAPIGGAEQTQGGYTQSALSTNWAGWTAPTPMMTYHELKFIEAEAKFNTGDATWETSLEEAIAASFAWLSAEYGVDYTGVDDAATYYAAEVAPRLTAGNEMEEIITQKYIALFEAECIESYNDYRRVGFPEMKNPNNTTVGFPQRFPYALSETSSNPDNVPTVDIYEDKIWWAGGTK